GNSGPSGNCFSYHSDTTYSVATPYSFSRAGVYCFVVFKYFGIARSAACNAREFPWSTCRTYFKRHCLPVCTSSVLNSPLHYWRSSMVWKSTLCSNSGSPRVDVAHVDRASCNLRNLFRSNYLQAKNSQMRVFTNEDELIFYQPGSVSIKPLSFSINFFFFISSGFIT